MVMPSLQPYAKTPPGRRGPKRRLPNAWRARVKWHGIEHWLGGFATREQAQAAENDFRAGMERAGL